MKHVQLLFPHQLFRNPPLNNRGIPVYLVEEFLFFNQYPFHKQKIVFHRASMKFYEAFLQSEKYEVRYVPALDAQCDIRILLNDLRQQGVTHVSYIDPVDNWLGKRIRETSESLGLATMMHDSPMFLNTNEELATFFKPDKKKYHQTSFYKEERRSRDILMDLMGNPEGGKWTFDTENRHKYPTKKTPPPILFPDTNSYEQEARNYVENHFSNHLGALSPHPLYPTSFSRTQAWFQQFLDYRFTEFGTYEDAIVTESPILHHSVLSPMLNVGLITPKEVIETSLAYAKENHIPINSVEGFIRQIIGWREFIRGIYEVKGTYERNRNYWGFTKKIPASFYTGTTGIHPVDVAIKQVLKTGYCHHIERLMVLGNFMLLCEFDPNEVYQWFMELFIDAYDWVMVPNVYGMSQFADGGLMSTKPYISGSNYLMKMGNYKKGEWQATWDGLFWRFMDKHRTFFLSNPRLGMLVRMFDKMPTEKRSAHMENAQQFLESEVFR